ncbi:Asp-tRNA(Asn)/Glu-tRNA(Gln) amidotransferase subunit GatC [Candidatus Woesebacteria bacterium]|nr:Asp-tRNA(Asn)/Glu-tRNA(Gln) amidotransferase subunit GatC [Candidatus Woesebacteria bacterium]
MSKLFLKDIEHVALLARLTLSSEEIERFGNQLSKIVDYVHELDEVDTSGIEPTSQTTGLKNVYRADKLKTEDGLSQDQAISGTEKVHNGYFMVPGILEERSGK